MVCYDPLSVPPIAVGWPLLRHQRYLFLEGPAIFYSAASAVGAAPLVAATKPLSSDLDRVASSSVALDVAAAFVVAVAVAEVSSVAVAAVAVVLTVALVEPVA